jgi:DNA-binding protein
LLYSIEAKGLCLDGFKNYLKYKIEIFKRDSCFCEYMAERLIPLAAMEKIMKNAGVDRVADDAKVALKEVIEEKARQISERAAKFALHAGRKTIKAEDIQLALNEA